MSKKKIDDAMIVKRYFKIPDLRALQVDNKTGSRVEGHAAVFNSTTNIGGWYNEIIERGAFDNCNFDDVPLFVNHDTSKIPLARSRRNNGSSTMQLDIDNTGLHVVADIDVDNNLEAKSLYSSIERQDIDGMSFMFSVRDAKWENLDSDMPTRRILDIAKVYEVSAVNWPAYEDTDIDARDKAALDNARSTLDNARSKELENSKAIDMYRLKNKILGGF